MKHKYFSLEELIESDTARKKGIDNTPGQKEIEHLDELMDFLDPLREAWGSSIKVNSGYRCERLNKAVGGSSTSAHLSGWAADLWPGNNHFEAFKYFVISYLQDKKYDQCIIEKSGRSQWIHLGLRNMQGKQRKMCFSITK